MSVLANTPTNKNLLSPTGFRFILNKTPNTNYFVYSAPLPTLSLGEYDEETPLVRLPYPGDKLRYEPLSLRFRVDEDLTNYLEIHQWLESLGYPEDIRNQSAYRTAVNTSYANSNVYSDGTLLVMSSHQNPNIQITFQDLFPISLSELTFDASLADIEYLEATATFRYRQFKIEVI